MKDRFLSVDLGAGQLATLGVLVGGVLLRLWAVVSMDVQQDGNAYAAMGDALRLHGGFWMPWGDGLSLSTAPSWSHHYPPLYPGLLGAAYAVFGFGVWQTKAVAFLVAAAALLVVWACTRNLYGRRVAVWTAAIVAVLPRLLIVTGWGFSENLVLAFFVLTLWAIKRSLDRPSFMVLAGVFAGLGYLTRAGMGSFFIIAGAGGLAWRLKFRGWAALRDGYYWLGGACFLAVAAWLAARNVVLWGDWQSSDYTEYAVSYAFGHPAWFVLGLAMRALLFVLLLAFFIAALQPEFIRALRTWRQESESLLWVAIVLVAGIGAAMAAAYFTIERTPLLWMDTERYVVIAYVPLLWLLLPKARLEAREFKFRAGALVALLLVGGVFLANGAAHSPDDPAAEALAGHLRPGDSIGIEGASLGRYVFYPYLPTRDVSVVACQGNATDPCHGAWPDFIMGRDAIQAPGYSLLQRVVVHLPIGGDSLPVFIYQKEATT